MLVEGGFTFSALVNSTFSVRVDGSVLVNSRLTSGVRVGRGHSGAQVRSQIALGAISDIPSPPSLAGQSPAGHPPITRWTPRNC